MEKHVIINVGRQFGSGGKAVADALGKILDIPVFDDEILRESAKQSGISPDLFKARDEKRRFWGIGNIFGQNRYSGTSGSSGINDAELFRIQSEAIRNLADKGSCIFVGRAANYVLRDRTDCINVFIKAPVDVRRDRISERRGISQEAAEALIAKEDKARAEFYNFFTFGHWGKAAEYDLCIDSSILGIEQTAEFIAEFGRRQGLI